MPGSNDASRQIEKGIRVPWPFRLPAAGVAVARQLREPENQTNVWGIHD
jgi:hypothetical protein